MTQFTEGTFVGANDTQLAFRSWRPQGKPQGAFVIVHGFKAHGGMYEWVAKQLTAEGFAVHVADLRGHGKSEGERYHVDAFGDYVADLEIFVDRIRAEQEASTPLFLLGHSAGGVIGCLYALRHQNEIAGFVCEDFAHALPPPHVALLLLKGVSHLAPHAHLLNLKDEDFSRDPAFVAAMKADPLAIHTPGTAQLLGELIRTDEHLRDAFPQITLPVMILHGTADHIAKQEGSQYFFDHTGSVDKTLKLYEGHYHDLLNDLGKDDVMQDVLAWTRTHTGAIAGV
jgi:acylglycerol lipase